MGITEETGKTVRSVVDGLSGTPVLLVQALIIAGVVFILYAQGSKSFHEREVLLRAVFDSQANVREILARCIVPSQQRTETPDIQHVQGPEVQGKP